jgi:LysM repeat protein
MNNPHPLIPQGSNLEQKNKGRARVKLAVFFVLAVHGIGLMALLVQGCHQEDKATASNTANTATTPAFDPATAMVDSNGAPATAVNNGQPGAPSTPAAPNTGSPTTPAATTLTSHDAPAAAGEYTVAKGDTFATIAKKSGVTTKALMEANPGVEATKLKPNQKIHVPAAIAAASPAPSTAIGAATTAAAVDSATGHQVYEVKSGDNLTTIAKHFGTSVKAIRVANSLKSDSLKVSQKLKIPAKAPASATTTTPAAETTMASSAPAAATTAVR